MSDPQAANLSVTPPPPPPPSKPEHTTEEYLWIYVSPIILLLGLCGNFLIPLVINRKNLRGTTTCVYLTVLAIFDTLALVSGIIPEWTNACGFAQFNSIHSFTCQLEKFVFYTSSDTAIWILMAFTLDRFVAVCFPLYKRSVCVPKRSRIACVVIFLLAFFKNIHVFVTRTLEYVKPIVLASLTNQSVHISNESEIFTIKFCGKVAEFKHFESLVRPWIAFATVSVLPFIILAVCNAMIIWALARLKKKDLGVQTRTKDNSSSELDHSKYLQDSLPRQGKAKSKYSPSDSRLHIATNEVGDSRNSVAVLRPNRPAARSQKSMHGGPSYKQTTMMCLSASITFLICIFPSIVMLIGKPYWAYNSDGSNNNVYLVFKAINNQLAYLNHSINFFLYCITGRKFRHELVLMFGKLCAVCPGCKIFEPHGAYDPSSTISNRPSVTGKWRGKLTSIFVANSGGVDNPSAPRQTEAVEMNV